MNQSHDQEQFVTIRRGAAAPSRYRRVKFGQEAGCPAPMGSCHDCGAAASEVHWLGCDVEECPACGGQLLGCECQVLE